MKLIEEAKRRIVASAIDTPQGSACYVGNALEELDTLGDYLAKMEETLMAITDQYEWMYETCGTAFPPSSLVVAAREILKEVK